VTDLRGAHVLVLGATGGLGSAVAAGLAGEGARLTLSARSADRLVQVAGSLPEGAVLATVPADLTLPGAPGLVLADAGRTEPLTGVVNAAGVVAFGDVAELDDDTVDELLLLDLVAPVQLVRAAVETLPPGGFVVQVSAVVAERPQPGMAAYSAVKAGLTAFDAAAAVELRRRRIRLLDVRPPHTETGLAARPVAGTAPRLPRGLDPAAVAARIVAAIRSDERDLPSTAFTA
jgi:cyclic-di-GMP-binding biofilm dispersal mediator protein